MAVCSAFISKFLSVTHYTTPLKYTADVEACEGARITDNSYDYINKGAENTDLVVFVFSVNDDDGTIAFAFPC